MNLDFKNSKLLLIVDVDTEVIGERMNLVWSEERRGDQIRDSNGKSASPILLKPTIIANIQ